MTRLPLALAGFLFALTATIASAQSYPQPYPTNGPGPMPGAYGPAMSQGAYGPGMMPPSGYAQPGMPPGVMGYAPMQQDGGYPVSPAAYSYGPMQQGSMQQGGMYPSLPPQPGRFPGPGPGSYAAGYGPGQMQPGMYPPGAPNASPMSGAPNQNAKAQQSSGPQEYHGPQGAIAKASPPPMKLPPGVHTENGLLYYNGSARGDVGYQPFAGNNNPNSPYRLASYQAGENGMGGSPGSVMAPGSNAGAGAYGGMQMGNGQMSNGQMGYGQGSPQGDQGYGQCQGGQCQGNCNQGDDCGPGCFGCQWLYNFCHGSIFPGKLGYVWSAGYDNLAMTRNAGTNREMLFTDNFGPPSSPAFNSNELQFNWDYGGRVHLELTSPSGLTYQATYTRIATFVTNRTVGDPTLALGNLTLAPDDGSGIDSVPGFFDVDSVNFTYTSAIQTGELNMIFPFGSFEFVAGYRYMQIDEHAGINTESSVTLPAFFDASSLNKMNGGQVGILGRWQMFGMIDFDFDAKFALMANDMSESQFAVDGTTNSPVTPTGLPITATKTRVSYVTELGLQGVVPLGSSFSFHAGYNVYFIDSVALAPNQFDFTNILTGDIHVNNHGDLVVQGVNCGFTAVW